MSDELGFILIGALCGMFLVLVVAITCILIKEHKSKKDYEKWHNEQIKRMCEWILANQPSEEELKKIIGSPDDFNKNFHCIPQAKGYDRMFENCKEGGEE